ncbi:MAG: trk/ktr system potassium uptake protein [Mycobacteriales bacterium]|jgi:trk system potassium uptake protein TrkA
MEVPIPHLWMTVRPVDDGPGPSPATCSVRDVHIVVMGCGRVGSSVARNLERIGHSVSIIDQNPAAFRRLGPEFRGEQVTGVGYDRATLSKAGIENAAAFAAVSSGDNSNIISARVARETFAVPHVVARIYDPKRAEVYERLGIPTVATVPWTTHRLLSVLLGDKHVEDWRDPSGSVALVQVAVHEGWVGHRVAALEGATGARVAFLTRFGRGMLPVSSTVFQDGDLVHLLLTDDIVDAVDAVAGRPPEENV